MTASFDLSQEIPAISTLTALNSSLERGHKHVLGSLRLYGARLKADNELNVYFKVVHSLNYRDLGPFCSNYS